MVFGNSGVSLLFSLVLLAVHSSTLYGTHNMVPFLELTESAVHRSYPCVLTFLNALSMAFLDELPLDILLAVVKGLKQKDRLDPVFYSLLPVASVCASLRQSLLPLLYRDMIFEFPETDNSDDELSDAESNTPPYPIIRIRHNASLANLAGCSEYAQRVTLFVDKETPPGHIVRAVRDDMDAGNENKWPNLRSYACIHYHEFWDTEDSFSCSDFIRQLDKELPKLRQASPVICKVTSDITPVAYNPPSVSFLTQLTSLRLECQCQCIDASRLLQFFAPTLVDLMLSGANPEAVWNAFYDGHENQTVVFARLKRLGIQFRNPLSWGQDSNLPPHLQGATDGALTKRSVWTAGAASGRPGCQVPLFPVLRTLWCEGMMYDFPDFISRTQCHNSLVSLCVRNTYVCFDFDAELFKNLETVEFTSRIRSTDEDRTDSMDLYRSAFTSLLRTKTNIRSMIFKSTTHDTIFQVPRDIGCTNLRSLCLGVEVDFKSMLRLLNNLKHLVQLELDVKGESTYRFGDARVDTAEDVDELQPPQADCPACVGGIGCRFVRSINNASKTEYLHFNPQEASEVHLYWQDSQGRVEIVQKPPPDQPVRILGQKLVANGTEAGGKWVNIPVDGGDEDICQGLGGISIPQAAHRSDWADVLSLSHPADYRVPTPGTATAADRARQYRESNDEIPEAHISSARNDAELVFPPPQGGKHASAVGSDGGAQRGADNPAGQWLREFSFCRRRNRAVNGDEHAPAIPRGRAGNATTHFRSALPNKVVTSLWNSGVFQVEQAFRVTAQGRVLPLEQGRPRINHPGNRRAPGVAPGWLQLLIEELSQVNTGQISVEKSVVKVDEVRKVLGREVADYRWMFTPQMLWDKLGSTEMLEDLATADQLLVYTDGSLETTELGKSMGFGGSMRSLDAEGRQRREWPVNGCCHEGPFSSTAAEVMAIIAVLSLMPVGKPVCIRSDSQAALAIFEAMKREDPRRPWERSSLALLLGWTAHWFAGQWSKIEFEWVK
ncbi:hypothetical protein GQ54DRAFT_307245 [Martensiomyces pterosporus]|nr:hypothetical protein GQ54DRAFT_307245 [Martensiomyces pterosporus]